MPRKKDTTFTFTNVNITQILSNHYEPTRKKRPDKQNKEISINELMHEKSKRSRQFLDPYKCKIKLWINMIDGTTGAVLPRFINKPCWFCRTTFKTIPIGCPIFYHSDKSSGVMKRRFEERMKSFNLPCDTNDFFETEGVFCGFPCTKSYILYQIALTKSNKYKQALSLLTLLHKKIYGTLVTITQANTWKVLKDWQGHLSTEEHRASTGKLWFEETPNMVRPFMFSSYNCIRELKLAA